VNARVERPLLAVARRAGRVRPSRRRLGASAALFATAALALYVAGHVSLRVFNATLLVVSPLVVGSVVLFAAFCVHQDAERRERDIAKIAAQRARWAAAEARAARRQRAGVRW
jgi:hypothetical protein